MSLLSRLFGGGGSNGGDSGSAAGPTETYEGYRIFAQPGKASGGYRVGARIEKEVGEETLVHQLIRADTLPNYDEACSVSVAKAKQMIDEQGERLFS
ncbi:MAG: HlyU family transcriptional regulator [Pseudomonadota bacterium]